jgi:ureidoglycolate lyase
VITLKPKPLTREAFAPYGDVIDTEGAKLITINQGFAEKAYDLANIDVATEDGTTAVHIFTASPRPTPTAITLMERHPLGTQLFYPLQNRPWLVVVCGDPHDTQSFEAFTASGLQGVNYAKKVWHHPLLVRDDHSRFLVVDRKGEGNNLEEVEVRARIQLL